MQNTKDQEATATSNTTDTNSSAKPKRKKGNWKSDTISAAIAKATHGDHMTLPGGLPALGLKRHSAREAEFVSLVALHFMREGIENPRQAAEDLLTATKDRIANKRFYKAAMRSLDSPLSPPDRLETHEEVEIAAAMRLPVIASMWNRLRLAKRGAPAFRDHVVTSILLLAFLRGRPVTNDMRKMLLRGDPWLRYAFGEPTTPIDQDRTSFYRASKNVLQRHTPHDAVRTNIALLKRLAETHPNIAVHCSIDGTDIEADCDQSPPRSPQEKTRRLEALAGRGMSTVAFRAQKDQADHWKSVWGWKLVILTCIPSGLPVAWKLIPADGCERDALRDILLALFQEWPTCPIATLVGDSYYDHDRELAHELVETYGIAPVFDQHGDWGKDVPYTDGQSGVDGVPMCKHGVMKRRNVKDGLRPSQRVDRARRAAAMRVEIDAGRAADDRVNNNIANFRVPLPVANTSLRIEFLCDAGVCSSVYTHPHDNPRAITEFPRQDCASGSKPHAVRTALITRRLQSESLNALLVHRGLAGHSKERLAKGTDKQVEWNLALGLMWLTARAVVHAEGLYEPTLATMRTLGIYRGTDSDLSDASWTPTARAGLRTEIARAAAEHDGTTSLEGYSRETRGSKPRRSPWVCRRQNAA